MEIKIEFVRNGFGSSSRSVFIKDLSEEDLVNFGGILQDEFFYVKDKESGIKYRQQVGFVELLKDKLVNGNLLDRNNVLHLYIESVEQKQKTKKRKERPKNDGETTELLQPKEKKRKIGDTEKVKRIVDK